MGVYSKESVLIWGCAHLRILCIEYALTWGGTQSRHNGITTKQCESMRLENITSLCRVKSRILHLFI